MKQRYHFHTPGLFYAILVILIGLAAMNNQNNLMFWLFGMLLSALVVSGVVSTIMLSSLTIRRMDPRHGTVGELMLVRYAVTNRSRFMPVFNIFIEDLPLPDDRPLRWSRLMPPARAWVMHVGPGETVHGEAVFWPVGRGTAQFERIRVTTTFPFGLIKKSISVDQPQHTLVYPMLHQLRQTLMNAIRPAGPSGLKMSSRVGAGDEFYGMREYRWGDNARQISWKRSAVLDDLVTIERADPSPPRLRISLDLTTPTAQLKTTTEEPETARQLEEQAICLAASLLSMADTAGYEVGLAVGGLDTPDIPLRRGQWHMHKIMAALASIELDQERQTESNSFGDAGERAGLVVIRPDRSEPILNRDDAWLLTASHLDTLSVRPLGWDPTAQDKGSTVDQPSPETRKEVSAA